MKIDYRETFAQLKKSGLIGEYDKYAVCLFKTESVSNGVTTEYITSNVDYIMVANHDEVKLLDIDKKTGRYLQNMRVFEKDDLVYEKGNVNWIWASRGLFGGRYIAVRADYLGDFDHMYVLPNKINGFEQKEACVELYELIKDVYHAYHEEQKRRYKENKSLR